MTWPDNQPAFPLGESYTVGRPVCFNPQNGQFSEAGSSDALWFYRSPGGPVIFNTCKDLLCLVDNGRVAEGERRVLRLNAAIQLGHYGFTVVDDEDVPGEALCHMLLDGDPLQKRPLPEVDDILPSGGHYMGDYRYLNEAAVAETEAAADILEALEEEYKKFLIWGEQHRHVAQERPTLTRLPDCDDYFEAVREEMKAKTLTECLIQTPSLIDKVWTELNVEGTTGPLIFDDEKTDILKLLAPENIASKEKQTIPELVFHDLYKPGLDSPY